MVGQSWDNIPDIARLKSRVIESQILYYPPCDTTGIPPVLPKSNPVDNKKATASKAPIICNNCPPGCQPYYITQYYDNFYSSIGFFLFNNDIRSASKAVIINGTDTIATCEDFYIKIKHGFFINDLYPLISQFNLTATDVSNELGNNVFKITEPRYDSRFCIDRAKLFFETGKCEFSTPNFYEFGKKLRTNDPMWNEQWNLLNTGQSNGTPGVDIRITNAWPISKGSNIKVAIIDEGVMLNHRDLQANLLPGLDVTGFNSNGGIVGGYDEIHGSQMAGIIGAIADNGLDIAGIAPLCKMIPIKAFHANWDGVFLPVVHSDLARSFIWAYQNGADVINCSWGVTESDLLDNAVNTAALLGRNGLGCVIVGAVANNNNTNFGFPENHPYVIAVGAMTACNERKKPTTYCDPNGEPYWQFGSNYGDKLSVVAPGIRVASVPVYIFGFTKNPSTGTSPSAAQVSGVAALILSVNPNLTRQEVQRILEFSCNRTGTYCYNWTLAHPNGPWNNEMGYGRLNAYNAVQLARAGVSISNPTYDVTAQAQTQVSNNLSIIFNGLACPTSLPYGVSFVRRFEVTKNITYQNTSNPIIICSSNGFNLANPNDGKRFAEAINVTNTSATLRTYIYYGYNSIGQALGWIPTALANIKFTYSVVSSPSLINYELQRAGSNRDSLASLINIPFNLDYSDGIIRRDIPAEIQSSMISPNPVLNELSINFISENNSIENLEIFNSAGIRQYYIANKRITKGSNKLTINVSNFPKGVYIIKVGSKSQKFIK